jgi:hypothetical protein
MKVTIAGCETNIKYIVFAEAKIGNCWCPCLSFFLSTISDCKITWTAVNENDLDLLLNLVTLIITWG